MNQTILRGFDLFPTRERYGAPLRIPLPPLYRAFYSAFDIGRGKMRVPGLYLPQANQVAGMLTQKIDVDVDFALEDFLNLDEAREFMQNAYEKAETPQGFWPIATCDANKCLVVGTAVSNEDEVHLENLTLFPDGSRYRRLAGNIFEFISKITYVEQDAPGYGVAGYDDLYRRWAEPYWRFDKGGT